MTRRLTCHKRRTFDGEELLILTLWQEGEDKETIKRENPYTKSQELLINRGSFYEYIKRAWKDLSYIVRQVIGEQSRGTEPLNQITA